MKVPNTICMGGVSYTSGAIPMAENNGYFDHDRTPNIAIADKTADGLVPFVLLHEIGHAVRWQYGASGDLEQFADAFANGVLCLLRDNPSLIKEIMRSL